MIIHSTILDTQVKVIEVYGGTTWINHSGYMLRGAISGVTANSAIKTGGEDSHTLTIDEMPSHNHSFSPGGVYYWTGGGNMSSGTNVNRFDYSATSVGYTGGGKAHNNIPNYKSVYIWERTA